MLLVLITGVPGSGKSTMAEVAGRALGAPVLAHDWAMSGLRPSPELQDALDAMGARGHRGVGWSLLWALARSQLRLGSSVVLDGVAREADIEGTRLVAREEAAGSVVILTSIDDAELHRARVEGRQRLIPDWYELDWDHVARARASWVPPADVDLVLEGADPVEVNAARVQALLQSAGEVGGTIERFFGSLSARDWAGLGMVLSPHVERVGPLGDLVRGRANYLELLRGSVPEVYGNDVHRIAYAPGGGSAFARVTEHLAYPDQELHLEEAYLFHLDPGGLISRVEIFWQSPESGPESR